MKPAARPRTPWLFPATYLLHAAEEYGCGETFPVWISRLLHVQFTAAAFLWLNGIAMSLMIGTVLLVRANAAHRWLVATLATIVTINAAAHTIASAVTWTYSPGLVTGLSLWLPLGVTSLRATYRELPRRTFVFGVAAGAVVHALVSGIVVLC